MTTTLVRVHGAELVDGRINFGGTVARPETLDWRQRVWRFIKPPLEVLPGERLVHATRLHWCVPVKGATRGGLVWPAAFIVNGVLDVFASGLWFVQLGLWLAAVCHLVMVFHRWIAWRAHLVVVTSERLLQVNGVFSNNLEDVLLSEIRKVTVLQTWWQRWFRFGTLRIELAGDHDVGAAREYKKFIPDPWSVHRAIRLHIATQPTGV